MTGDSYAERLGDVLKDARNAPLPEIMENDVTTDQRLEKLRAAAIVAVISLTTNHEDVGIIGRMPGTAWSQDHRRTRMGYSTLSRARSRRATWR